MLRTELTLPSPDIISELHPDFWDYLDKEKVSRDLWRESIRLNNANGRWACELMDSFNLGYAWERQLAFIAERPLIEAGDTYDSSHLLKSGRREIERELLEEWHMYAQGKSSVDKVVSEAADAGIFMLSAVQFHSHAPLIYRSDGTQSGLSPEDRQFIISGLVVANNTCEALGENLGRAIVDAVDGKNQVNWRADLLQDRYDYETDPEAAFNHYMLMTWWVRRLRAGIHAENAMELENPKKALVRTNGHIELSPEVFVR